MPKRWNRSEKETAMRVYAETLRESGDSGLAAVTAAATLHPPPRNPKIVRLWVRERATVSGLSREIDALEIGVRSQEPAVRLRQAVELMVLPVTVMVEQLVREWDPDLNPKGPARYADDRDLQRAEFVLRILGRLERLDKRTRGAQDTFAPVASVRKLLEAGDRRTEEAAA